MRGLSITERFTFGQLYNKWSFENVFWRLHFDFEGDYEEVNSRHFDIGSYDSVQDFYDYIHKYEYTAQEFLEEFGNFEVAAFECSCRDRAIYIILGKELCEEDF